MASFASDETISRIVETYSPMLLRLACTRLDDPADAEDIVQEVFLKLFSIQRTLQEMVKLFIKCYSQNILNIYILLVLMMLIVMFTFIIYLINSLVILSLLVLVWIIMMIFQ